MLSKVCWESLDVYYKYFQVWLPLVAYLLALWGIEVVYMGDFGNDNAAMVWIVQFPTGKGMAITPSSQQQRVLKPSIRVRLTGLALSKVCWENLDVFKISILQILANMAANFVTLRI